MDHTLSTDVEPKKEPRRANSTKTSPVLAAVLVWGLAIIGFGAAVALANGRVDVVFWLAFIALVIGGAADMVSAAFRTSMLQTAASDEVRGRLQGVFLVVVAGAGSAITASRRDATVGVAAEHAPDELAASIHGG